jgi:SNF2 family DNA or RNA helicase
VPFTPACKVEQTPREDVKYTKENPKLEALEGLFDTLLAEGELNGKKVSRKVIVWAHHHPEMNAIEANLKKRGVGYVRVDGRTGNKIQERITKFNTDPGTRVYLGQIATGVGITLNAATYMVYYSLDWSLRNYLQSIDRNYRAGQTEKVTVYRLLGKGTVDEYKVLALDQKKDLSNLLTSNIGCFTCKKNTECLKKGIEIFDAGCIYKRSARRTVARAEAI